MFSKLPPRVFSKVTGLKPGDSNHPNHATKFSQVVKPSPKHMETARSNPLPFYPANPNPMSGAGGVRLKGYGVNSINGTQRYQLQQPGNMKLFAGLNVYKDPAGDYTDQTITLLINSDTVLDQISIQELDPTLRLNGGFPFIPVNRKIEGADDMAFTVTSTAVLTLYMVVYYYP